MKSGSSTKRLNLIKRSILFVMLIGLYQPALAEDFADSPAADGFRGYAKAVQEQSDYQERWKEAQDYEVKNPQHTFRWVLSNDFISTYDYWYGDGSAEATIGVGLYNLSRTYDIQFLLDSGDKYLLPIQRYQPLIIFKLADMPRGEVAYRCVRVGKKISACEVTFNRKTVGADGIFQSHFAGGVMKALSHAFKEAGLVKDAITSDEGFIE